MRFPRSLLLLALAACTTFPAIDRNICGNGIVEPGEDCDSTDPSCVACAIACTAATDCPASYACGVDHTCRAPGGALGGATQPQAFPVDDFRLADIDKDGRADLLGVSKTSISVRFGDDAAKLDRATSFVTPVQSGTPSFGDLDGDGATDVTISTVDGLVAFASQYSVLSPLTTKTHLSGNDGTLEMVFPITLQVTGALLFDGTGKLQLAAGNLNDMQTVVNTTPCGNAIDITDFAVDLVDIYVLPHNLLSSADDVVLTINTKKVPSRPCVMAVHVETNPKLVIKITSTTPATIGTDNHKLVLADITDDNDPCPAVVDTRATLGSGTTIKVWPGKYLPSATDPTLARCGFVGIPATLTLPSTVPATATAVGRVPLVPKVPGGPEALMLTSGIYVVNAITANTGSTYEAYRSFRELDALAVGDLDGNGQVDAVASSAGEDDLDVLFRRVVIPGIATFQLYRLDTANVISRITVGDFDGDQIADIGYTEHVIGHERMLISYGTSDRPETPVEVATFGELISIIPANFLDSSDQLFQVTDLIVIERDPTSPGSVATVLHGSPQRTMLSFYTPTGYDAAKESFRGSIIGNFTDDKLRDVVAVTEDHAWMVVGTGAGFDVSRESVETSLAMIGRCDASTATSAPSQFCTNDGTYLAWPTATSDVIFAVDRATPPHGIVVVPPTGPGTTMVTGQPMAAMTAKVPPGATLRALYALDLDGDGANELVETFGPPFGATSAVGAGVVLVCPVSGMTVGACTDVRDAITAVDATITTCIDATPGRFTFRDTTTAASPGNELAVLCYDGTGQSALFAIKPDRTAALVQRNLGPLRAIRAGDVTGDGVGDLVGITGGDAGKALVVFPQCSSRDLACLGKGGL